MPVDAGTAAPTFALKDASEGREYDLSQAVAHGLVLLGIYKSSCQASKTAFPFLQKLMEAYSSDQITVWGISQDSPNVTRSFARRAGVTFPILIDDNDYAVSRAFDILATPTIFLIDGDGTVLWQRTGFQKPAMDELSQKIAEMLGTAPVDITSGTDDVPAWVPG